VQEAGVGRLLAHTRVVPGSGSLTRPWESRSSRSP
jgi:hypothetical protein